MSTESALAKAEAALAEARQVRGTIGSRLGLSRARAERLRKGKGPKALAAACGDEAAQEALARANASLLKSALEVEDLAEAERQAAGKVAAAEAELAVLRNVGLADEVEKAAEELVIAARAVDLNLASLAEAFRRRNEVAQQLYALHPPLRRDAGLRIEGEGAATRAARSFGLHRYLKLPWSGDSRHEIALAAGYPVPEIEALIAALRGEGSSAGRSEAA